MRLKSHLSEPGKSHKIFWIKKLKKQGLKPLIESVEENISTYEEACQREIYFIDYFKSIGCDLTNMTSGGDKNKKMSEESKKKISESLKKRYKTFKLKFSDQAKDMIRKSTIERFKDPKEREKLRIANKRYEDSKTHEQKLNDILIQDSKKVYQYDKDMNLIEIFVSIRDVVRKSGIVRANISKCCHHKVVAVGGFIWRFEGDLTPPQYKNRKVVLQYDLDGNFIKEWNSGLEAKEKYNGVYSALNNRSKTSGGYIWKYKNLTTC